MIRFSQVFKRYKEGNDALKGVSFFLPKGSLTFLIGHSGAGKSTLLKLIASTQVADRGQVLVNEQNLARMTHAQVAQHRRSIGCVFQDYKLLNDRTVYDNVALSLIIAGVPDRDCKRRVRAALDKVGLLHKSNSYPLTLSGGEQQRVGIARAVVTKPQILLADEPTGNLDPEMGREILELLVLFQKLDVTVVIATHDYRHLENRKAGLLELQAGQIIRSSYH